MQTAPERRSAQQRVMQPAARFRRLVAATAALTLLVSSAGCGVAGRAIERNFENVQQASVAAAPIDRAPACGEKLPDLLSCDERLWAESAWKYVERNTHPVTGIVNRTEARPVATMWDVADAIAATYAARELALIDTCTFDARFGRIVAFLNSMPLVDELAPNRWYNIENTTMVDGDNKPAVVGWSTHDLGRLLLWLRIVEARHPIWSEPIGRAVARWNFCAIVDACGTLNRGVHTGPDTNRLEQEGRLGYEEYAAAGFAVWGFDVAKARAIAPAVPVRIDEVELQRDARDALGPLDINALSTTPFAAYEMELGSLAGTDAPQYRALGRDVARVQYDRYRRTRSMTARTHRPLATPPWLVYDSVWFEPYSWNTVDANGRSAPYFALVSTAAVFELWAAYPDDAATQMLEITCALREPDRGWYAGRSERSGGTDTTLALRTNAAVLESILHRKFGTIYRPASQPGWLDLQLTDEFFRPGRCLPGEERRCGDECPPLRHVVQPTAKKEPKR